MFDLKLFRKNFKESASPFFIAGCDEVGRGPLAGPVVSACVSLHFEEYQEKEIKKLLKEWEIFGVTDSKKISSEKRQQIISDLPFGDELTTNQIYTHVYSKNLILKVLLKEISAPEIDEINILNASLKAMKQAAEESCEFSGRGLVLIDGNRAFKNESSSVELMTVVEGDSRSLLIALASIVAKEYRDNLMKKFSERYPGYQWSTNAGYGTKKHLAAIAELGVTELHRKTFAGVKEFLFNCEVATNEMHGARD